jgi:RHS repeat-associated protein
VAKVLAQKAAQIRVHRIGLLAVALTVSLAVVVAVLAGGSGRGTGTRLSGLPTWLKQGLGAEVSRAELRVHPQRGVRVSLGRGYEVLTPRARLSLATIGVSGAWRSHQGGRARATWFGREAIVVGPQRAEDYLAVNRRLGPREWHWRLAASTRPRLAKDGSVRVGRLRILPVAISDLAGNDLTPVGLRWRLRRDTNGWRLGLRLNDSRLPVPYVIDPATNYGDSATHTKVYLSKTASTVFTGAVTDTLLTSDPASACTAGTNCPGVTDGTNTNGTYWQSFTPNARSTTETATNPIVPVAGTNTNGWMVDAGGNASPNLTDIPSGTWTFNLPTKESSTANVAAVTYSLAVGVWVVTTSGTSITSVDQTVIDPTVVVASGGGLSSLHPFSGSTTTTARTISVSAVPEVTLNASQHLILRVYGKKVTSTSSRENASVDLVVGNSGTNLDTIVHPAVSERPSVPALVSPANLSTPPTGWSTSSTVTMTATFSDPNASDTGQLNFQLCRNSTCTASSPPDPIASGSSPVGIVNGANGSWTKSALADGDYFWRAQGQDQAGTKSAYSATREFKVDTTAPNGGSVSVPATSDSTTVTVTTVAYTDSGSGIASNTIRRSNPQDPSSPGVCPSSGYTGATTVTSPDTVPTAAKCYVYTLTGTDQVGNSASVSSQPVLVKMVTHLPTTTYTTNTEWTAANSPYVLDGTLTVASGATLTIDPGVIVKFNGQLQTMYVNGTLSAVGTAANPITFTSYQDDSAGGDTNGDGTTTSGAPGQWIQISFSSSGSQLTWVNVRDGGYAQSYAPISLFGNGYAVNLDHATISRNTGAAVSVGSGASATITNSTLTNNGSGLSINTASATVDHTSITNNTGRGVSFNLPTFTPFPPATSITNSEISGNGSTGVYIGANGDYPLPSMPWGTHNNIYNNNSGGLQLDISGYPGFTLANVNWRQNYWGSNVYYWYDAALCTGNSPSSTGHLAYRGAGGNVPAGPIPSGVGYVQPDPSTVYWCGYDNFKLGPGDFSRTKFDTSPSETFFQTQGSIHGRNRTRHLADPVNSATGSFDHQETDISLPGIGVPFTFTRYYHSLDVTKGDQSQGWTNTLAASLAIQANGDVVLRGEDGQQEYYTKQPDGSFVGEAGTLSTLAAVSGAYDLTRTDQVKYHFDNTGRLLTMLDRNGQGLTLAYNGNGQLATVTDATGRTITFTHNASGLLIGISAPGNQNVSYGYNSSGQLTSYTDPNNKTWTYSYDVHGFLGSESDPLNHTLFTNTYGDDGRVTQQTDALNHATTFSWDPNTQTETATDPRNHAWKDVYSNNVLVSEVDPSGDATMFGADTSLNQTSVAAPSGGTTTMTYDANGNMLTATAPSSLNNAQKVFTFDSKNNVTSVTDARGKVTSYGYDAAGNNTSITLTGQTVAQATYNNAGQMTSSTDGNNKTTSYGYDAEGNLTSVTDPLGDKTTYTYDNAGRVLTEVDPLGNVSGGDPNAHTTTDTYDADGRLLTETDPLNHTTTYTYDDAGNELTVTDANNNTTTNAYNAANQLTSVTGPDPDGAGPLVSPVTTQGYDAAGNRTSVTDPLSRITTYGYDNNNRLISVTTPKGETTTFAYDSNGRMASNVDPRGNVQGANPADYTSTYTYDAAGRLLSKTDPLNQTASYTYDPTGNESTATDANNHTTSYTYDDAGRILTVSAPDNGVTTYTYDGAGNVLTRKDANNHVATYTYDDAGNLISKTLPNGDEWTYDYDPNGNLTSIVDPNGNATQTAGDGTTTDTYDNANRLKTIGYSDSTPGVNYSYDAVSNRTSMSDGNGAVNYGYDNLNRLTSVTRGLDTFSYSYDASNNITNRTYPDNTSIAYTYDEDHRLASVASGGATTSYSYDAAGNLTQTLLPASNGYTETRTYDRAGRLTEVKNANANSTLSDFAYTLDAIGNPTSAVETGATPGTTTYTYDANDRLASVCYQSGCPGQNDPYVRWTYDQVGNRLTETRPSGTTNYTYNNNDEVMSAGSTSYTYDHNGNETGAGSRTFSYNVANELTSAGDGSTTTTYTYDGDGSRLQAATGSQASQQTNYLWDTSQHLPQIALERDGNNTLLRRYIYGVRRISMTSGGNSYYYAYDGLGSVANMTSSTGATEWTYHYDPFGVSRSTTQNDPNAAGNPMQFAGEYLDATGLYNLRARQYDSTTGRFLSIDPVEQQGALRDSSYAYAADRPTILIDPSGMTFIQSDEAEAYAQESVSPAGTRSLEMHAPPPGGGTPPRWALPFPIEGANATHFGGIDQGVDYRPNHSVKAIGPGVIYRHDTAGTWGSIGGDGEAIYVHLDYPAKIHNHPYHNIYYAEQHSLVTHGHVSVGEPVMIHGWDELGFAKEDVRDPNPAGPENCVPSCNVHHTTLPTRQGKDFHDWLFQVVQPYVRSH